MKLTNEQKAMLFDALHADGVDNWDGYQMDNWQETMKEIESEALFDETYNELEEMFEILNEDVEVEFPAGMEAGAMTTFSSDSINRAVKFIIKKYKQD